MSQFNSIPQVGPKSGAQMADAMQKAIDAANSAHFGATEPSYKTQGMIWVKNVSSTINEINIYDGAQWILLSYFNPTTHALTNMSLVDNQVTTAKLQQIATSRILGRKTASTGNVEVLTPADVMGMLPDAVGDSGAGGVAGRVPAAPSGSAAAGYFLAADMTFKAPPSGLRPGTIGFFAMEAVPSGWLAAHGQAVSRTTYAPLYAELGDVHGAGNGTTTFNLPDYRGMVLAGLDDMGGTSRNKLIGAVSGLNGDTFAAQGGSEDVTLDTTQIPAHLHTVAIGSEGTTAGQIDNGTGTSSGTANTSSVGGGLPHSNVQPTAIVLICIKT